MVLGKTDLETLSKREKKNTSFSHSLSNSSNSVSKSESSLKENSNLKK